MHVEVRVQFGGIMPPGNVLNLSWKQVPLLAEPLSALTVLLLFQPQTYTYSTFQGCPFRTVRHLLTRVLIKVNCE